MRSKLMLAVGIVLVAAMLAGGATMALFTDTETTVGNAAVATAGTVRIAANRDLGDPIPGPMFYTTAAEGMSEYNQSPLATNVTGPWWPGRRVLRLLDVENMGSLGVRLHKVSAAIQTINGQPPSANQALADSFASNMNVEIYVSGSPPEDPEPRVLYSGTLANLLTPQAAGFKPELFPFLPPAIKPPFMQLAYRVTMNSAAGNDLQGIRPIVSFSVYAEQTANNP